NKLDNAVDLPADDGRGSSPNSIASAARDRRNRILRTVAFALTVILILLVPLYVYARSHVSSAPKIAGGPVLQVPPVVPRTAMPTLANQVTTVGTTIDPVVNASPVTRLTPMPLPTAAVGDSRYALVLLGYGGAGHDGAYLTDSMMVVIVDPSGKTLTLLSLPRDSWVPLSFDGTSSVYDKINTAYAYAQDPTLYPDRLSKYAGGHGAGVFVTDTVSNLLGIPVSYYLGMDFQGFRDMINAVGGIDVDVPVAFAALYPANDDSSVDPSWITISFSRGQQHMSGERAIEYARAREAIDDSGEGSDFARSRRQRLIIEAFKTRLFEPGGLAHLPALVGIASQHVDTNYAIPAVGGLSQLALDWKSVKIYQTALTIDNYLQPSTGPQGTYILTPNSPDHSWAPTRAFVRRLWQDPAAGVALSTTRVIVENDSGIGGLATSVGDDLARLGYRVDPPRDGMLRARTNLVDGTGGSANPLFAQLSTDLGLGTLDVSVEDPASGDLIVQLGEDAANVHITVPEDTLAPFSIVGVEAFGNWVPATDSSPTPELPITDTVTVQSSVTATAEAKTSGGSSATPTPRPILLATPIAVPNDAGSVLVPKLIGLSEAIAQTIISQSDLMTTYVNYQTASEVPDKRFFNSIRPGSVLSQFPPAGTKVPRGTRVLLAVRKP
ncbi:MAG TPA: LCP family protein, partial [Chloroflexota bacterium]|nr:LCP family protein [Chloroflexota bacterium]